MVSQVFTHLSIFFSTCEMWKMRYFDKISGNKKDRNEFIPFTRALILVEPK